MNVKLTASEKIRILNSTDIYDVMQKVLMRENKIDRNKEHFWIIGLANNNKILYIELISLGTIKSTLVEPMEVFSIALQKRSVKVILVHNHPSGELLPSEQDKDLTDRLQQIGFFLEVPVADHLIISEKSYYSFAMSGMLAELSHSKRYLLPYKEQERMKKEAEKIGEERGLQKGKQEVAKELKQKGIPIATIAEATGLSEIEIKRLKLTKSPS
jgi:DNA repair protein RadC